MGRERNRGKNRRASAPLAHPTQSSHDLKTRATIKRLPFVVIAAALVTYAIVAAARVAWTCDDAFISYRYAEQFVGGLGLVFNPGERVEGYSNFLWTVWIAVGMKLKVGPETWSILWGIVFYAGTVILLESRTWWARGDQPTGAPTLPIAAVLASAHPDWHRFATSGLETSLYTFLLVLSFVALTARTASASRTAGAGVALALVALCRPDGPIFAVLGALFVVTIRRPPLRQALAFLAGFLAVWVPYTAWRVAYYGDFFSNTYFAKSAALAWYPQGWTYVSLYFQKYWVALLGLPLIAIALVARPKRGRSRGPEPAPTWQTEAALAAAFALVYTLYVMRVGGDFMFARFLIPVTPFYFILVEIGLARLGAARGALGATALTAGMVGMIATPHPLPDHGSMLSGIVNEPTWYSKEMCTSLRRQGVLLATKYFHDLPVCMAFTGMQARLVFYAKPEIAIETTTGLTDRFIARQPLTRRGRVGHEKSAPREYVLGKRHAHLIVHFFNRTLFERMGLTGYIPKQTIIFDDIGALLLHWDPAVMAEFKTRGAQFGDFPTALDSTLAQLDAYPDDSVRRLYDETSHFYFEYVDDPSRESRIRARLARTPGGTP